MFISYENLIISYEKMTDSYETVIISHERGRDSSVEVLQLKNFEGMLVKVNRSREG